MFGALLSKLTDYHGDFFRNINRPRAPREVFADLAQEARDALVAEAAEATTRKEGIAAAIAGPFDYAAAITYPFVPVNWHASRFSDGLNYGVCYGSIELETTVYETAYHWHRFVMDAYASEDRVIRGDRQVFKVRCDALLIDLREKAKSYRWITHRSDYRRTQRLGAYLARQGQRGVLTQSARANGGNGAIFSREVLSAPRHVCYLTYAINPARDELVVARSRARSGLRIVPSTLY
jgi:hypothetical protein